MEHAMSTSWPNACDCHMHVYEDSYPLAPTATFTPPHAPAAAYREVQRALGLTRAVVIQPTGYGFDNRCTLSALPQLGPETRAVVVVPPDVPEAELDRLHAAGARGIRYMMLPGGVLPWSGLEATAARIAPRGWHIDLQLDGCDLPLHEALLARLPGRLVIDHVGKFLAPVTTESDAFLSLRRLLDRGNAWIKLSGPYETSRSGAPDYEDIALLARALAGRYPDRCLWASNWPHPNARPEPSNPGVFDWARRCVGNAARWQKILVDNPAEVYGFSPTVPPSPPGL
jgi:D-galactarolactone isomerase